MSSISPSTPRRWRLWIKALAAGTLLAWPAFALGQAPVTTAQMQIQAEVVDGCRIGTISSGQAGQVATLNFAPASGLDIGRQAVSTAAVQVAIISCTAGMNLNLQFDAGQSESEGMRRMQLGSGGEHLPYWLCPDAACSEPIAPNGSLTRTISAAESQNVRLDIFGVVQLSGNHVAGAYADLVTIIFSW